MKETICRDSAVKLFETQKHRTFNNFLCDICVKYFPPPEEIRELTLQNTRHCVEKNQIVQQVSKNFSKYIS